MRVFTTLAALAVVAMPIAAQAQNAKPYTAAGTPVTVLMGDPAAMAAMTKVLPQLAPRLEQAKDQLPATLTLAQIKDQAGITDAQITELDAELAKIK